MPHNFKVSSVNLNTKSFELLLKYSPHIFITPQLVDNHLAITNVDVSNSGRYTCKSYTDDNQMYSAEYELNVDGKL